MDLPGLDHYQEIWVVDFEFYQPPGDRPRPICLVAREIRSHCLARQWLWDEGPHFPPYEADSQVLFIAYYASAELGCHLAHGWPIPARILDLYVEFRCLTSGLSVPAGHGLLGALLYFGLDTMGAGEKENMRQLAQRGGPYTPTEAQKLLDYCQEDTDALARLLPVMLPQIDLPRALLRGRYMGAVARMEWAGVPIDTEAFNILRERWPTIQDQLIAVIDRSYEVYRGRTFDTARFAHYLNRRGMIWPHLPTGRLALDEDTFREMSKLYPELHSLHQLRMTLGQLKNWRLQVGTDGRNRCLLSPFASVTSRNQPSTSRFIFGPSAWLRGLIRGGPGWAVINMDWEQQEFGTAAALSGDPAMIAAYQSGDPYLASAKQAGAVPADATKESHGEVRELFKTCDLGVQYGLSVWGLARRLDISPAQARSLLAYHRGTYKTFWRWIEATVDYAMLHNRLVTCFGWAMHPGPRPNPRSLLNFPMQAHGAEMMRLAACLLTERGLRVCAPVHDAFLVEAPVGEVQETVIQVRQAMAEASGIVLNGFALRTDAKVFAYPERYLDKRGAGMWNLVWKIIDGC
jgi:hypothetical protein